MEPGFLFLGIKAKRGCLTGDVEDVRKNPLNSVVA
jgi:hypothetical protein